MNSEPAKIDDGGPAFPIPNDPNPGAYAAAPGMSLRDWFAGRTLQGLITHGEIPMHKSSVAEIAVEYADALIKALK